MMTLSFSRLFHLTKNGSTDHVLGDQTFFNPSMQAKMVNSALIYWGMENFDAQWVCQCRKEVAWKFIETPDRV